MNLADYFRAVFNLYPAEERPAQRQVLQTSTAANTPPPAGRVSENGAWDSPNMVVVPPRDHESFWRLHDLDTKHLDLFSPQELLDMLVDISPDISVAVWHFQRLCNPGWECKVYGLNSEKKEHKSGKKHVDELFGRLRDMYGSVDILFNRFFMGAYLRGAFCAELVLDAAARETLDIVVPDPYSVRFRKRKDALRGEIWEPGQWQSGKFVSLDIPTFRYLPVDPAPASPYGRSLASPALFVSLFSLSLLHDVKRVVMQQGYKRMDIILNTEQAMDNYSYDPQGYASLGEYIGAAIDSIKNVYLNLQPDDAFIHTDIFQISTPVGTADANSIAAIDQIMQRLEGQITRALKSNGVVMDTGNNTNETDSNRKWEIHAAGIKSLQHHCENMMESLLNLSLRAKGIAARVEFRFAELRAAEMFRDEQTRALRIQNSRNEYEAGFVSQDEAANSAVNHDADQPEPRKSLNALDFQQDNNSGNEELVKQDNQVNRWIYPPSNLTLAISNGYDNVDGGKDGVRFKPA